eukprot:1154179-Pelagomonas_calceolata.AAC.3
MPTFGLDQMDKFAREQIRFSIRLLKQVIGKAVLKTIGVNFKCLEFTCSLSPSQWSTTAVAKLGHEVPLTLSPRGWGSGDGSLHY